MNKACVFFLSAFLVFLIAHEGLAAAQIATYEGLLRAIRETRAASQARVEAAAEQEKVRETWETGKLIDEHILVNKERAQYGERVLQRLSFDLGMSKRELHYMVEFARTYPIVPTSAQLSWGHYRDLLAINDPKERKEIEDFAEDRKLPLAELRKEIKKRRVATTKELEVELTEITPGPLYTYQLTRLKDRLKIDLGFGVYHGLPEKEAKEFKEGDIVTVDKKGNLKKAEETELFTYSAVVTQVVDGDTFHALIDLGFEVVLAQRVRLRRINAPEIISADGQAAKALLEKILFRDQGRIILRSRDLDQHGRPIADVWVRGESIDQELLDKGLAVTANE